MGLASEIIKQARALFDVASVSEAFGSRLIILGLESKPERNLDDFGIEGGNFRMYGFEKYVKPKLDELLSFIRGCGFKAEPVGRYGYPLEGEINLKREAIRTGLGRRGKNTLVLHPDFGPWLRFMAITTDAPLEVEATPTLIEEENPDCEGCSICLDVCPVKVLEPYHMVNPRACLSHLTRKDEEGRSILCDLCLQLCPAGKRG